jgi:pimeloyl-ACP methyl ester carboxylesterase
VGDATDLARRVEVPALVIHTEADPIVPLSYGRRLASLIPGAQLKIVDGYHTPSTPAVFEAVSSFLAEDQPIPRGSGIE